MGCFHYGKRNTPKRFTGEFKQQIAESMMGDKFSCREIAQLPKSVFYYPLKQHLPVKWPRVLLLFLR